MLNFGFAKDFVLIDTLFRQATFRGAVSCFHIPRTMRSIQRSRPRKGSRVAIPQNRVKKSSIPSISESALRRIVYGLFRGT